MKSYHIKNKKIMNLIINIQVMLICSIHKLVYWKNKLMMGKDQLNLNSKNSK
jgi:hypothetical protein